jgi:hypothetical protein
MPGKTRRQRIKASSKRNRAATSHQRPAESVRQPEVIEENTPVDIPPPAKATPFVDEKPSVVRNPYIASELWTIGILAIILLVVLIVLGTNIP